MDKNIESIKWCVPGILPEGLSLLVGKPKLGKSFLALNIALAVAGKGKALGSIDVESDGDVLYLALEDGERRMQDRLRTMTAGGRVPGRLHLCYDCQPLDLGGLEMLEAWLNENPKASLVVIDTFTKIRQRQHGGNLYTQDYQHVAQLQSLAARHRIAIIAVYHSRKAQADDVVDAPSGTLGLSGAADAVTLLSRYSNGRRVTLRVTGRDIPGCELPLHFDPQTCTWQLLADVSKAPAIAGTRAKIIAYVDENGPSKPAAIASGVGASDGTVRQNVKRMVEDGQLRKCDDGTYAVTVSRCNADSVTPLHRDSVTPLQRDSVNTETVALPPRNGDYIHRLMNQGAI